MIELKNVFLKYTKEFYSLYDINLKIDKGETIALLGKENSGKSSILRLIAKLEKAKKDIEVEDTEAIRKAIDELSNSSADIVSKLYAQAQQSAKEDAKKDKKDNGDDEVIIDDKK